MNSNNITDEQIERLKVEAIEHGDFDQAAICDTALDREIDVPGPITWTLPMMGTDEARAECARVIDDAKAMAD